MKIVIGYLTGQDQGTSQEFSVEEIHIGRSPDNDIVLDQNEYRMVSRRHATIRAVDGEYILYDEGSANGTFLNGVEVQEDRLSVGDHIMLGRDGPVIEITHLPVTARLIFMSGPHKGDKKILAEEPVTIGRDATSDIILPDFMVSRSHARIEFRNGAYWLIDEQSKNGTYIEGRKVDRAALKPGQVIRFGFDGPEMKFEAPKPHRPSPREDAAPKSPKPPADVYGPPDESRSQKNAEAYEPVEEPRARRYRDEVYEPPDESRSRRAVDETYSPDERRSRRFRDDVYEPEAAPKPARYREADDEPPGARRPGRSRRDAAEPETAPESRRRRADRYAAASARTPRVRVRSRTEVIVLNAVKKWKVWAGVLAVLLIGVIGVVVVLQIRIAHELSRVRERIKDSEQELYDKITKSENLSQEQLRTLVVEQSKPIKDLRKEEEQLNMELYFPGRKRKLTVDDEINKIMRKFGAPEDSVPHKVREQVIREIRRYSGYLPTINARKALYWRTITRIFQEKGLPEEMAYIAWVESEFRPDVSNALNATGMWQIMPKTAEGLGLKGINTEEDERKDVEKSTEAASRYIKYLMEVVFNSKKHFLLVVASYNTGQGNVANRIRAELREQILAEIKADALFFAKTPGDLYWSVLKRCPEETQQYIPRFLAAVVIGTSPEILDSDEVRKEARD